MFELITLRIFGGWAPHQHCIQSNASHAPGEEDASVAREWTGTAAGLDTLPHSLLEHIICHGVTPSYRLAALARACHALSRAVRAVWECGGPMHESIQHLGRMGTHFNIQRALVAAQLAAAKAGTRIPPDAVQWMNLHPLINPIHLHLVCFKALVTLDISTCLNVDDSTLCAVLANCSGTLKSLFVCGCLHITAQSCSAIIECHSLRMLDSTDSGLKMSDLISVLSVPPKHQHLTELHCDVQQLDDLFSMPNHCTLRRLSATLRDCSTGYPRHDDVIFSRICARLQELLERLPLASVSLHDPVSKKCVSGGFMMGEPRLHDDSVAQVAMNCGSIMQG